jgi:hypothetical protein
MSTHELTPDCGRFRSELPGLVYDEPAPDARAALEAHIEGCAACREELATLRDTRRMLARWETPVVNEDPRELARAIVQRAGGVRAPAEAPRRGRLMRFTAMASASAAAVLFLLALFGTHASLERGRLELSFGLPGSRPAPVETRVGGPLDESFVRTVANEAIDDAITQRGLVRRQDQEELLQHLQLMSREEMQEAILRLARATDVANAERDRAYQELLATLGREAARADLTNWGRIQDLEGRIQPVSNPTTNR